MIANVEKQMEKYLKEFYGSGECVSETPGIQACRVVIDTVTVKPVFLWGLIFILIFFCTAGCSGLKPDGSGSGDIRVKQSPLPVLSQPVKPVPTAVKGKITPVSTPVKNSDGLLYKAERLYEKRRYPEVIREVKEVIKKNPRYARGYGLIGKTLIELKRYREARVYLNKALKIQPDLHYARIHLGESYFEAGDYDKALSIFKKVEELDLLNVDAILDIGEVYVQKKNYELAEKYLKKAISMKPEYFSPYNEMGNLSYLRGNYSLAIEYYKKSLEKRDDYEDALIGLGLAHTALKEYKEAEGYLERAIRINEEHCGEALSTMGDTKTAQGLFDEAERYYKKAIETDKYDAQGYLGLGKLYLLEGKPDKAEEILSRSLKINPRTSFSKEIHYNLALIYGKRKDKERTLRHLKLSLGKDGDLKKRIGEDPVFEFLRCED